MGKLRDQLAQAQTAREAFETRQAASDSRSSREDREQSLTYLLLGLASFYLAIRFGLTTKLDALGKYASYIFEIGLVGYAIILLRPKLSVRLKPLTILAAVVAFGAGLGILKLARLTGIAVPMNVNDKETVVFLIGVAPVLEELIFRFLLWKPIELVFDSKIAMIVTSFLFSYSHLHAIWFVPAEYDKFLIYQTAYTLPLAFACGWLVSRQKSLLSAVLLHFAFNLGFFVAFWI